MEWFKVGGGESADKLAALQDIFVKVLEPLYGSQNDALDKIKAGEDRYCFVLYEGTVPVGVLVFKIHPTSEYAVHGVSASIEIKSLFVVDADKNSGKGIGSKILKKLYEETEKLVCTGFHVTVSETKSESSDFFTKKGFERKASFVERYKLDTTEYLYACHRDNASKWLKRTALAVNGQVAMQ
jgi:L-amino acid N-acyltransferase YncA